MVRIQWLKHYTMSVMWWHLLMNSSGWMFHLLPLNAHLLLKQKSPQDFRDQVVSWTVHHNYLHITSPWHLFMSLHRPPPEKSQQSSELVEQCQALFQVQTNGRRCGMLPSKQEWEDAGGACSSDWPDSKPWVDILHTISPFSGLMFHRATCERRSPYKNYVSAKFWNSWKWGRKLPEGTGSMLRPNASSVLTGKFHKEPNLDNSPPLFFKNCFPGNPLLGCDSHTTLQEPSLLSLPSLWGQFIQLNRAGGQKMAHTSAVPQDECPGLGKTARLPLMCSSYNLQISQFWNGWRGKELDYLLGAGSLFFDSKQESKTIPICYIGYWHILETSQRS